MTTSIIDIYQPVSDQLQVILSQIDDHLTRTSSAYHRERLAHLAREVEKVDQTVSEALTEAQNLITYYQGNVQEVLKALQDADQLTIDLITQNGPTAKRETSSGE